MNKPAILIVEDDKSIRNLITVTLEAEGYPFYVAENAREAILASTSKQPDIVLLDLGLPDMDGVEVIKKIRSWSEMPIIIVSARSDDRDKVEALDAGADDYITKPFSVEELLARVRAVTRRLKALRKAAKAPVEPAERERYVDGELEIDFAAKLVRVKGEEIHLTNMEYKLLAVLARNSGKVLTYKYLLRQVWGSALESDMASLRVFMVSLRKKLAKSSGRQYLQTHVGIGYRLI
ncbi:response regulator transcription factor [Veillonellaceae bacterium WCA-693-APC-5D-A]|uniref:Response regulator transcription factor n=1 Tax=Anaerovibrio slackiae TaxID=2652309 RepID=A0A6I2UDM0_9FIRM|nr:response regulator transcription factor [Anaerovibrio slackiae]MSU07764.1 response regulator transcription factor [Anaerovibrio slackiae]